MTQMTRRTLAQALVLAVAVMLASGAVAAGTNPMDLAIVKVTSQPGGGSAYSVSLQILLLMTAVTLLPSIVIMMTAFTRIVVVFAILRQALGMQQTPSNQILVGLALFMTLFVMAPVLTEMNRAAIDPYLAEQIDAKTALDRGVQPLKKFMLAQTRAADLEMFIKISRSPAPVTEKDVGLVVLVPAFVTSELKTAFQIGFMLFIPFLVIDMVVASVLMSMGMMMLSPLIISLPFKIMLFVMVDGWVLIMGTLASSFAPVA